MSSSSIDLLASITLLVGLCVKVDEQQEVAGEQGAAKVGGILGSTAVAKSREGGVGKGKVSVGAEVDDEQVDDELNDLHGLRMGKVSGHASCERCMVGWGKRQRISNLQ